MCHRKFITIEILQMSWKYNIIISEKYNIDEESDIETYDKVYELKFLKKEKMYVYLFNWECPFLTADKIDLNFIY